MLEENTELIVNSRPGTSHIAAADHTGLAVTVTTTINLLYGSRVMIPETGVIMNCQMDGTSADFAQQNKGTSSDHN